MMHHKTICLSYLKRRSLKMVASKELCPLHQQLIEALDQFPASWALTPVYGDKRPYRRAWQTEIPITKDLIKRDIKNGKPGDTDYEPGRYQAE
jgi:hypothetical protein